MATGTSRTDASNRPRASEAGAGKTLRQGHQLKRDLSARTLWLMIGGVCVFVSYLLIEAQQPPPTPRTGGTLAPVSRWYVLSKSAPGCRSAKTLERILDARHSGDNQALGKLTVALTASGECSLLSAGTEVYVTGTADRGALSKVRKRGEVVEYWIGTTQLKLKQ